MQKEKLILFETAKLAKEKGFDWETFRYYEESGFISNFWGDKNYNQSENAYSAPTQSLLQQWFRVQHDIIVFVTPLSRKTMDWSQKTYESHVIKKDFQTHRGNFVTYEEALDEGLRKAFEYI